MGSLLGVCLIVQIVRGLILSIFFLNREGLAFSRVIYICQDVEGGWLLRAAHANGASIFFICLYSHIGRGIYYSSFRISHTWAIGVTILLAVMATAFLGYVLPWGQISFWGATVITSLLSTLPYLGTDLVQWLWGGYAVGGATLTRFFAFHFILPMLIRAMVIVHILYLHQTGSNNPLGVTPKERALFSPYFASKDFVGFLIVALALMVISLLEPYLLGDPENFNFANPLRTPLHIQPEWYYLFAYAILRSIPNKLGGVVALALSVVVLYVLPFRGGGGARRARFYTPGQLIFWVFVVTAALLS